MVTGTMLETWPNGGVRKSTSPQEASEREEGL
jgi:hypothetical protein